MAMPTIALLVLLPSKGRTREAAAVESALAMLTRFDYNRSGSADSSREATGRRSGQVILLSTVFVKVLGLATVLWLAFVIVPQMEAKRRLPRPLFEPPGFAALVCSARARARVRRCFSRVLPVCALHSRVYLLPRARVRICPGPDGPRSQAAWQLERGGAGSNAMALDL